MWEPFIYNILSLVERWSRYAVSTLEALISKTQGLVEDADSQALSSNNRVRSSRGGPSSLCCFHELSRWFWCTPQLQNPGWRIFFTQHFLLEVNFASSVRVPNARKEIVLKVLDEDLAYQLTLVMWQTTPELSDFRQPCGLNGTVLLVLAGLPYVVCGQLLVG